MADIFTSGINSATLGRTTSIGSSRTSIVGRSTPVNINDAFIPWQKIQQSRSLIKADIAEDLMKIITQLFIEILHLDAMIVPAPLKRRGNVIMEASFLPPKHERDIARVMLPIANQLPNLSITRFSSDKDGLLRLVTKYVDDLIQYFAAAEIVHFIVVAAHEYGHLMSFRQGNHSQALARGLMYLQQGYATSEIIDRFTWLVFKEEYQAWHYGERLLKRLHFEYWQHFNQVKNSSLATYIQELHLERANLRTCYRLSSFGDDFINNCPLTFFQRKLKNRYSV